MMRLDHIANTPGCAGLCLSNNILYAIGNGLLSIYDVHIPTAPHLVGQLSGLGGGRQLAVCGNFLLATARERGLWLIDISSPCSPKIVSRTDTVELATGIAIWEHLVYVAQRLYGVEVFYLDASKACLRHLSLQRTDEAQSVVGIPGGCVVGDWKSGKVTILKLTSTGRLEHQGHARLDGYGDGVCVNGDICCIATGHHAQTGPMEQRLGCGHGLELYDISNRNHPKRLSRIDFPKWPETLNDFWTVRGNNQFAFVSDTHNGFHVVDIHDKSHPLLLYSCKLPICDFGKRNDGSPRELPDCVASLAIGQDIVYVAGLKTGLWTLPISITPPSSQLSPIKLSTRHHRKWSHYQCINTDSQIRQACLVGRHIFAAASSAGLLEISPDANGSWNIARQLLDSCIYDVKYINHRLYVADGLTRLAIFEHDQSQWIQIASYENPKLPIMHIHISQDNRFAIVTGGTGQTTILDIHDLDNINIVFQYAPGQIQYGDFFPEHDINGILPNNWHYNGIAWYDLTGSIPGLLKHEKKQKLADQIDGIGLFKNQFLIAAWGHGYWLGNEQGLKLYKPLGEAPHGIPSYDGSSTVFFSCRRSGRVQCYDFRNPEQAVFIPERSLQLEGTPGRVLFLPDGRAIIPAGYDGLLIENNKKR